jgi:hypothetical protein
MPKAAPQHETVLWPERDSHPLFRGTFTSRSLIPTKEVHETQHKAQAVAVLDSKSPTRQSAADLLPFPQHFLLPLAEPRSKIAESKNDERPR